MVDFKKSRELHRMSDDQLKNRLSDVRITLHRLKMRRMGGRPGGSVNPGVYRSVKKENARILTIQREREIAKSEKKKGIK